MAEGSDVSLGTSSAAARPATEKENGLDKFGLAIEIAKANGKVSTNVSSRRILLIFEA